MLDQEGTIPALPRMSIPDPTEVPVPYPLLPSGLGSHEPCDANGRGRKNLSAWDWACSGGAHCCSDGSVDKPPGAPGSPDPPNSSHYGPSAARCCVGAERRQVPSPPAMADPGTPTGAGEAARVRGKAIRPAAGIPREHPRHNYRAPSFFPPSGSSAPHSPSYTPSPAAGGRVQVGASTQGPALPPPPKCPPTPPEMPGKGSAPSPSRGTALCPLHPQAGASGTHQHRGVGVQPPPPSPLPINDTKPSFVAASAVVYWCGRREPPSSSVEGTVGVPRRHPKSQSPSSCGRDRFPASLKQQCNTGEQQAIPNSSIYVLLEHC